MRRYILAGLVFFAIVSTVWGQRSGSVQQPTNTMPNCTSAQAAGTASCPRANFFCLDTATTTIKRCLSGVWTEAAGVGATGATGAAGAAGATGPTGSAGSTFKLDIDGDDVNQSTALNEIETHDDTNGVFSIVALSDILDINVGQNWPQCDLADTATAFATPPTGCASNQFANAIDTGGNLTCAAIVDADVPSGITIALAATATSPSSDPSACTNQFVRDIGTNFALTCESIADADLPDIDGIVDNTVVAADFLTDGGAAAADELCLTYEVDDGEFEWQSCGGAGSGTMTTTDEAGVGQVGGADIVTLDFGLGFDLNESPDTEMEITLDYTEDPVNLNSAEITGELQDANVADDITITLAATATALVGPTSDCAANEFATAISDAGALTCAALDDTNVPDALSIDTLAPAHKVAQLILSAPTTDDEIVFRVPPWTGTVTHILCETNGGTSVTISVCEGDDLGDDVCDNGILTTSTVVCDSDASDQSVTVNTTYDNFTAREEFTLIISAVSGAVDQLEVYITGTVD